MREIKFRAWDNKTNEMGFDESMGDILCEKEYDKPHLIIMQFIGLKDKNGKEIFEGDIVKAIYENKEEVGGVFWDKKSASFDIKGNKWKSMENLQEAEQYYEVIGNIFENPELLNDANQEKSEVVE